MSSYHENITREYKQKLYIQKTKIMAFGSYHFMANRWGNSGSSVRLYFLGLQNHCRKLKKMLTPWKESYDQPRQHIKKQRHYFFFNFFIFYIVVDFVIH